MSRRMSLLVSAFLPGVTYSCSAFGARNAVAGVQRRVQRFVPSFVDGAGLSAMGRLCGLTGAVARIFLALSLAVLSVGCALRFGSGAGPQLVSEMPLGNGEELVVRTYKMPLVPPNTWPEYAYWVCEKRSPARRAFLTRGRYESMPIHASDDLRFLVMDYTIMAGISKVGIWRRVQGPLYRHVDAGLGWEEAFEYYLREWKAGHSWPEDKDLPLPDRGAQVQVRFVRWTKPNREILLSLDSQYGGPNAKEHIDHWYFLCDLETLRLSRDLTGVELPPDEDAGEDQTQEPRDDNGPAVPDEN